jgi:hypothetical protein
MLVISVKYVYVVISENNPDTTMCSLVLAPVSSRCRGRGTVTHTAN